MSIDLFLLRMPKVELHVHLEGSIRPAVLLELARRNGVDLPAQDEAGLKRWFRFRDFEHFVQIYLTCSKALRTPEDFQLLANDFLASSCGARRPTQRELLGPRHVRFGKAQPYPTKLLRLVKQKPESLLTRLTRPPARTAFLRECGFNGVLRVLRTDLHAGNVLQVQPFLGSGRGGR